MLKYISLAFKFENKTVYLQAKITTDILERGDWSNIF